MIMFQVKLSLQQVFLLSPPHSDSFRGKVISNPQKCLAFIVPSVIE